MRSIRKGDEPNCLNDYEKSSNWDVIETACKDELAHKCFDEQNGLCIYCESELEYPEWQKISHCEHLVPRSTRTRVFDFSNITLSCNGTPPAGSSEFRAYGENQDLSCGHSRVNNCWEPDLFLHPIDVENIEQFFNWDLPTEKIIAADSNERRANYMIDLLNLNNSYLRGARNKARGAFRKMLDSPVYSDDALNKLLEHRFAFSSFLKATINIESN